MKLRLARRMVAGATLACAGLGAALAGLGFLFNQDTTLDWPAEPDAPS
jgi:hypothetical protein